MRLLILSLMLLSGLSHGQNLQDVIYKKDGSVLRGVLIEQDFNNGRYKIQLNGGSVFSVEKADIEKISKEAPLGGAANNGAVNINIDNSPTINQNPTQTLEQSPNIQVAGYQSEETDYKHVFYIGSLVHTISRPTEGYSFYGDDLELKADYTGVKLGFQQIFTDHIATQYVLNKGSLESINIVDEDNNEYESGIPVPDEDYLGLSASVILSSNLQKGWQFFTGLGIFHDTYSYSSGDDSYDGAVVDLGLGYSWKPAQLQLHYQARLSSDYPDDVSVGNFNLQLGFNF